VYRGRSEALVGLIVNVSFGYIPPPSIASIIQDQATPFAVSVLQSILNNNVMVVESGIPYGFVHDIAPKNAVPNVAMNFGERRMVQWILPLPTFP